MRIAAISPFLPYEGVPHAGGHYLLRHLEALARGNDVQLFVPGTPDAIEQAARCPSGIPLTITPLRLPRGPASLGHELRRKLRFRSLPTPSLLGIQDEALPRLEGSVDIVELHWLDSALVIPMLRSAGIRCPVVVVAYDITAHARPAFRRLSTSRRKRLLRAPLDRLRALQEAADLNRADLVLVFKDEDLEILADLGVDVPGHVIEPSVDLPAARRTRPGDGSILFTGAMRRPENSHGVAWFLREVWPEVLRQERDARFVIAGDSPPEWLSHLAGTLPGVTVTGTVDDLVPFYERAHGFVAPLFAPGGVKFKVPQAMAHDLPVVGTPVAVEGFRGPRELLWAVTDDAAAMSAAVIELLRSPAAASAAGRRAGDWVRERYSFEGSTERLLARYVALRGGRDG